MPKMRQCQKQIEMSGWNVTLTYDTVTMATVRGKWPHEQYPDDGLRLGLSRGTEISSNELPEIIGG